MRVNTKNLEKKFLNAIKAKCKDCCCGVVKEVELCESKTCPLYPYRNMELEFKIDVIDKAIEELDKVIKKN